MIITFESANRAIAATNSAFDEWWESEGQFHGGDVRSACKLAFLKGQRFGQGEMAERAVDTISDIFESNPDREGLVG